MKFQLNSQVERWTPLLLAAFIAIINVTFLKIYPPVGNLKDLFNSTLNLGGIMLGFLTASQTILFSIDEKYVVKQLKSAGVYQKLLGYFMNAIQCAFLLIITSIISLGLDWSQPSFWNPSLINIWVFIVSLALLSCYRIVFLLSKILQ